MIKQKKHIMLSVVANLIIFVCIFSVFSVCFNTETLKTSATINGVYYKGNTENKNVSLMINVYWGTEFLDEMLETLKKYEVKTTFFVGGYWVTKNEDMLRKIIEQGHEVGNHGYYHKDQDKLSLEQNIEEISMNHQVVFNLSDGYEMKLFAPPSGAYNSSTVSAAESLNYKTIMWTKDTIDWRDKDESVLFNRAVKNKANGDLILMHPTRATANILENVIKSYLDDGFKICTVSENIA